MPDFLNQREIDALLSRVDFGEMETKGAKAPRREGTITAYDFCHPQKVSKDQMQKLAALHEGFARNLAPLLSALAGSPVRIRINSVEQITYGEFILSLPNPTYLSMLDCLILEGPIVLEINPSITYPIIDRLLGGSSEQGIIPDRPLTQIEQRLVDNIHGHAVEQLRQTWQNIRKADFKLVRTETNPDLVQMAPSNEPVVLISLEISMPGSTGMMNLCVPLRVIEPIVSEFTPQHYSAYTKKEAPADSKDQMIQTIGAATLDVSANLAETTITVRNLLSIKPGGVIKTDKPIKSDITLSVEGMPKFFARPGVHRKNKAVMITRKSQPNEKI